MGLLHLQDSQEEHSRESISTTQSINLPHALQHFLLALPAEFFLRGDVVRKDGDCETIRLGIPRRRSIRAEVHTVKAPMSTDVMPKEVAMIWSAVILR